MLSRLGRGFSDVVVYREKIYHKIDHLLKMANTPVLTDIEINFKGKEIDMCPNPIPDLFEYSPVIVAAHYVTEDNEAPTQAVIQGFNPHGEKEEIITKVISTQLPVEKILIKQKLDLLTAQGWLSDDEKVQQRVIQTSIEHSIPSPYTSLIAFETRQEDLQRRGLLGDPGDEKDSKVRSKAWAAVYYGKKITKKILTNFMYSMFNFFFSPSPHSTFYLFCSQFFFFCVCVRNNKGTVAALAIGGSAIVLAASAATFGDIQSTVENIPVLDSGLGVDLLRIFIFSLFSMFSFFFCSKSMTLFFMNVTILATTTAVEIVTVAKTAVDIIMNVVGAEGVVAAIIVTAAQTVLLCETSIKIIGRKKGNFRQLKRHTCLKNNKIKKIAGEIVETFPIFIFCHFVIYLSLNRTKKPQQPPGFEKKKNHCMAYLSNFVLCETFNTSFSYCHLLIVKRCSGNYINLYLNYFLNKVKIPFLVKIKIQLNTDYNIVICYFLNIQKYFLIILYKYDINTYTQSQKLIVDSSELKINAYIHIIRLYSPFIWLIPVPSTASNACADNTKTTTADF
ncbi:hypothetical protein RFI_07873 [Reticulomyxa filosa]|uniref:Uncharacterized protein n=1 Tax=Reticulomyxa filosa TaxID=46433 RepID=X6NSH7_RETFI|nr:hypothetical protein RFI_07873 [Reticulomyxa filosa]|eukprot:ETO29250.1 hypothetical protein RFI_07873 [Reticulomyxa filosa]